MSALVPGAKSFENSSRHKGLIFAEGRFLLDYKNRFGILLPIMKNVLSLPDFTPTQWSTNADKQKFARHFIRFVMGGFKWTVFPKWFYTRLSNCRGHIAHYSQAGFYNTWFSDRQQRIDFFVYWTDMDRHPIYGDPRFTYSDVERFLVQWIRENHQNINLGTTTVVERE